MTPGRYLRLRRVAAGLSIEEVALRVATDPDRSMLYRAEWIAAVEADTNVLTADIIKGLHRVFAFDRHILVQLIAIRAGAEIVAPDICGRCGCSWDDPCRGEDGTACGWQRPDRTLCTACAGGPDGSAIRLDDRAVLA